jgi:hypothetical protein
MLLLKPFDRAIARGATGETPLVPTLGLDPGQIAHRHGEKPTPYQE